ncbi:30S ribosomal protein S11 [Candidatus Uhrbacteria bacterium]|nr:MAG: 30S ribosomal protein S11 [Candidatus Uhrbacteria bacterium]
MSEELKQSPVAEAETAESGKKAKAKPRAKGKKKTRTQVPQGRAYIQATYNNTIVTLTDPNGNVLAWSSAGVNGFKGPKKATPYAASVIVKDACEKVADYGLKEVSVFITGVGQGREGALRALNANGLNVLSIKDVTPIPHNGCRPPRPRRV